jgi:hypothetical protein
MWLYSSEEDNEQMFNESAGAKQQTLDDDDRQEEEIVIPPNPSRLKTANGESLSELELKAKRIERNLLMEKKKLRSDRRKVRMQARAYRSRLNEQMVKRRLEVYRAMQKFCVTRKNDEFVWPRSGLIKLKGI